MYIYPPVALAPCCQRGREHAQTHIQPHAPLVGRVARDTPMGGSLPIGGGVVIYPQREQYLSSRGSVCAGDVLYMTIPQSMQCIVYIFVYL